MAAKTETFPVQKSDAEWQKEHQSCRQRSPQQRPDSTSSRLARQEHTEPEVEYRRQHRHSGSAEDPVAELVATEATGNHERRGKANQRGEHIRGAQNGAHVGNPRDGSTRRFQDRVDAGHPWDRSH